MEPSIKFDGLVEGLNFQVSSVAIKHSEATLLGLHSAYFSPLVKSDSESVADV